MCIISAIELGVFMPSRTLVCFSCKETKSKINIACSGDTHKSPSNTCPKCKSDMHEVYNIPNPKKNDAKAWRKWEKETLENEAKKKNG